MYYTKKELISFGFKKVGSNIKISKLTRFYKCSGKIGNNVRIDDDVVIKGRLDLGNYIHIARGCTLSGGTKGIEIDNYTALSNFVQVFTITDNHASPTLPSVFEKQKLIKKYCSRLNRKIFIGKGVIIGCSSTILPLTVIEDFCRIGAHSIIYEKIKKGCYYSNFGKKKIVKIDYCTLEEKIKDFEKTN
ncbi:hypothetical protein IDG51_03240 [Pelagibacterales bacterium SAG-MED14]|nr:hypothetical protein [Pelagibacterales bacterium SAG-MED14]